MSRPPARLRPALDALARAAARADVRRLGEELGPLDGWRVRRAWAWSERRVPPAAVDPAGETVHRLRVAWLRLAGLVHDGDAALGDAAVAAERFHAAHAALGPAPAPRRWSRRTWLAVLGGVVLAAVLTIVVARIAGAPAPPVGDGATLSAEAEEAFADALTDWAVGLDRATRARHDGALDRAVQDALDTVAARRARMLTPEVRAFFGEAAVEALDRALDEALRTTVVSHWEDQEEVFAEAVRELNHRLAEAGRAYFFDGYAALYPDGRAEAALFLFRVVARRTWRVADGDGAGDPIDALHLRRLDHLNIVQLLLGYTSKRMDVAALLLDQLEKEIVARVGPSLAPGALMPLSRDDDGAAWSAEVRRVAGERIRQAFDEEMPGDRAELEAFGVLLAQRLAVFDRINDALAGRGLRMSLDGFELSPALLDEVERNVGRAERRELEAIQEDLAEHADRFARVLARHARPVEQHEVQHRLDYALGTSFEAPRALLDLMGVAPGGPLARHEDVLRTALELSAYTSEIARDPRWAAINLTLLAEHLFDGGGGAEGHAAILVIDGLRAELGVPGLALADTPPVTAERAAEAYLALMRVPGDNLARAASALWTRWFGRALPELQPEATP